MSTSKRKRSGPLFTVNTAAESDVTESIVFARRRPVKSLPNIRRLGQRTFTFSAVTPATEEQVVTQDPPLAELPPSQEEYEEAEEDLATLPVMVKKHRTGPSRSVSVRLFPFHLCTFTYL